MENLPRQLVYCRKSKNEISLDRARKLMESEIDIISLIKSRRYMKAALRDLLPDWRIAELKSQSYFVSVNPDLNTDSDSENDSKNDVVKVPRRGDELVIEEQQQQQRLASELEKSELTVESSRNHNIPIVGRALFSAETNNQLLSPCEIHS